MRVFRGVADALGMLSVPLRSGAIARRRNFLSGTVSRSSGVLTVTIPAPIAAARMQKAKKLFYRLRSEGFAKTVAYTRWRCSERFHEWRLGIRTSARIEPQELGITSPYSVHYAPTEYRSLFRIFREIPFTPGKSVFLDYGCGMGRSVIVAATLPFRRAIGVELSAELSEIARQNVLRARPRLRCPQVDIVTISADQFTVPPDVTTIYLYNPFHGPVLSSVFNNIRRSLEAAPRQLTVIFNNPYLLNDADINPWLRVVREFQGYYAPDRIAILENR